MIMTLVVSIFSSLKPELQNRPTTVAAVLVMICGSRMLDRFKRLAMTEGKERDMRVIELEGKYGFEVMRGVDGKWRLGVAPC